MIKLKLYGCKDITKCPVPGCEKTARNDKIIEHQMELVMFNDDDQAASEENPRFKDLSNAGKNHTRGSAWQLLFQFLSASCDRSYGKD